MKTKKRQTAVTVVAKCVTMTRRMKDMLSEFNREAERASGMKIGESFVVRAAFELLMKKDGAFEYVAMEKSKFNDRKAAI